MRTPRRRFRVILEPGEDHPTWYVATSPDLRGLVTQRKGIDDAIANMKDAMMAYFDGRPPKYVLDVRVTLPMEPAVDTRTRRPGPRRRGSRG